MTILTTLERKLSLGELYQKDAVQRGFCSGTEENHENFDGVGRSQDLPDAHCLLSCSPAFKRTNPNGSATVQFCCKNKQVCFTDILTVPLDK